MFQSTHSLRSATIIHRGTTRNNEFQSTHSLRSATDVADIYTFLQTVSIHALLAECDRHRRRGNGNNHGFNPRTPCGVRHTAVCVFFMNWMFQSTHSLRSATKDSFSLAISKKVSIHALLAECDSGTSFKKSRSRSFNPRTPCGVRLLSMIFFYCKKKVSIHALLAECDFLRKKFAIVANCFNPRTPCGVRRNRLYTLLLNRANHTLRQPP